MTLYNHREGRQQSPTNQHKTMKIEKHHTNRQGEFNGKTTYSVEHEGGKHTRTTKRNYISCAVIEREDWESPKVVWSGKILTRDSAISQYGASPQHFTQAPDWGMTSNGRAAAKKRFEAWKKETRVTVYTLNS